MTYSKPEVAVLGDAVRVIELIGKGVDTQEDPGTHELDFKPAYDLDE